MAAGGDLTLLAGGAISVLGSTVTAGGDALLAARGPVTIAAVLDTVSTTTFVRREGLFSSARTLVSQTSQTNVASVVAAGGDLAIVSGSDITVTASNLVAGGDLGVFAAGSVSVLAGQDAQQTIVARRSSGFGLFGTSDGVDLYQTKRTTGSVTQITNVASTLVAGGDVTVIAGQDINLTGSAIVAGWQATLAAGRDLTIAPGFDRTVLTYARSVSGVGVGGSVNDNGVSAYAGYHSKSSLQAKDTTTAVASLVAGGSGVSIHPRLLWSGLILSISPDQCQPVRSTVGGAAHRRVGGCRRIAGRAGLTGDDTGGDRRTDDGGAVGRLNDSLSEGRDCRSCNQSRSENDLDHAVFCL